MAAPFSELPRELLDLILDSLATRADLRSLALSSRERGVRGSSLSGILAAFAAAAREEGGLLEGVSDEVRRYIDYDQWARDLLMDYTVEDAEDGGVIVFRNL